jgi:hypothetical protein
MRNQRRDASGISPLRVGLWQVEALRADNLLETCVGWSTRT